MRFVSMPLLSNASFDLKIDAAYISGRYFADDIL